MRRRWEKHFEAGQNFGADVIDVFGRRVQARRGRGRGGGAAVESGIGRGVILRAA